MYAVYLLMIPGRGPLSVWHPCLAGCHTYVANTPRVHVDVGSKGEHWGWN